MVESTVEGHMSGNGAGLGGQERGAGEVRSYVAFKARQAVSWWVRSVATLGPSGVWK